MRTSFWGKRGRGVRPGGGLGAVGAAGDKRVVPVCMYSVSGAQPGAYAGRQQLVAFPPSGMS